MHVSFVEVDITPEPGIVKIGWLKKIAADTINDPVFAHIAIFKNGNQSMAIISLDLLSIRWSTVKEIRSRIEALCAFPGSTIMVCATHNHAGPAVANIGDCIRDERYLEKMVDAIVKQFARALDNMQVAEIGFQSVPEFSIAFNRRVILRDGTVKTHGTFNDPLALCIEGPIDPYVSVIAARSLQGKLLGCLVNYACHPTHFGGDPVISAGFPGVLAAEMKLHDCPVTLFLNGAAGNVHTANPAESSKNIGNIDMNYPGKRLAENAKQAIGSMIFNSQCAFEVWSATINLPYRKLTNDEIHGLVTGAQRNIDPAIYERSMPRLVDRIKNRKCQPAEIQVLAIGDVRLIGIPAEYFVEFGLAIKEKLFPLKALIVGYANGMVGYVPTEKAFSRGGYETTFSDTSRLAPEAGDVIAAVVVNLVKEHETHVNNGNCYEKIPVGNSGDGLCGPEFCTGAEVCSRC